ncbi:transmembrane protein, putative [Bodo saltans]|uniref:Transmembrane protein, putative n=1 Tax=Bodo saltans TaxID=75058 RepID=A0A0S4KGU5_BODSA|nr:transmembrane protein, putative [Bodo saltans]|eukprot:CUI10899.1 transmembrane protein, putative [Bodo saltans]
MSTEDWRHKLITVFGWSFDFFTVAVSITDVISDLLVAVQFLRDGHTLWAWLVFGAFINSSFVYSIVLTNVMSGEHNPEFSVNGKHVINRRFRKLSGLVRFFMILPFSQLAPTGMYVFQTFVMPHWRRKADDEATRLSSSLRVSGGRAQGYGTGMMSDADVPVALAAVHREEVDAVQGTFTVVGRLQDAVKRQVITHGMLFAETIVESIPQSIIQLLAITFLGTPSTLQVVSMALSILSVVSKAYFLSLSACLRVFVFKFSVLSFDVLSMFYIFSTILSKERSQDVGLFGSDSLRVSNLTYAWFVKLVAMAALTIFFIAVVLLSAVIIERLRTARNSCCCRFNARHMLRFCLCVIGVVLSVIPVMLVQESAKLSWLLIFLVRWEPKFTDVALGSLVYAFLERVSSGDGATEELRERQVHFMRHLEMKCPDTFPTYNNVADRIRVVGPFLYRHIDFLCEVEGEFLAKYRNAYEASQTLLPTGARKYHCDYIRRGYTPLSNIYAIDGHPLGYLNYSMELGSLDHSDRLVSDELQDVVAKRWAAYEASIVSFRRTKRNDLESIYRTQTIAVLAECLRDQEVHQILAEYRKAKMILSTPWAAIETGHATEPDCSIDIENQLSRPPLLRQHQQRHTNHLRDGLGDLLINRHHDEPNAQVGVMHLSQYSEPINPWTKILREEVIVTPKQLSGIAQTNGFHEKLEQWKFERIFHPKRLEYFFEDSPERGPPLELISVNHAIQLRTHNVFGYLFWFWFVINAVANCGFSIAFVFVAFATTPQNLLQKFCFWFSIGFLILALCTLPGFIRYWHLLPCLSTLCTMLNRAVDPIVAAHDTVVSYYDVSTEAVLASTAPHELLPEDLRSVVAHLLGSNAVDKSELTRDECVGMKRKYRRI